MLVVYSIKAEHNKQCFGLIVACDLSLPAVFYVPRLHGFSLAAAVSGYIASYAASHVVTSYHTLKFHWDH